MPRWFRRLRGQAGFGLIELLMAITLLNIGILAIVAAFNSGIVALRRASLISTGTVLADQQMELYRKLTYDQIALDSGLLASASSTYKCDPVLGSGTCPYSTAAEVTQVCTSPYPNQCNPERQATGPDHHKYSVMTYILNTVPVSGQSRTVKQVTVVVRDSNNLNKVLARETSTFDCSTGQPYTNCPTS